MADLQAEIEFSVEFRKFYNIDLFAQGYYQIRASIKCNPKFHSTTKVEINSECPLALDESNEQIYPASVFNDWGISKTFLIIYKNEELQLDDQMNFKLSIVIDAQNLTDCFNRMDLQLVIELYFTEKEYSSEKLATMQQLCSRCFKLNFNPRLGIHTHVPIIFDYFHLSSVTTVINGSLLCLIPPFVNDKLNSRRTSLFSFLFGQDLSQITTDQINPNLLDRAYQLHNLICEILLSSYESLQDFHEKMISKINPPEKRPSYVPQKCRPKLQSLSQKIRSLDDIHNIDNLAHAHIAQCSAENIMLWCQFIETFGLHEMTAVVLAKEYHLKRVNFASESHVLRKILLQVKRFSEGFFIREVSRINFLTNESETFLDFHDLVRNSAYYLRLPHLPVECNEFDGVPDTLPILIEEVYCERDEQKNFLTLTTKSTTNEDTKTNAVVGLPTSATETNISDDAKPENPKTSETSASQPKLKTEEDPSKFSEPYLERKTKFQNSRRILSFRNIKSNSTSAIVASSHESSIQLKAFKKFNENVIETAASSTPIRPHSATIESNSPLNIGLFSYQSDSDINHSGKKRSNSLRFWKRLSSHSLPDVDKQQRRGSLQSEQTSNPSTPIQFFAGEKPDEDVFVNSENENSSGFADSSVKSKVLQASFRGKVGTMERRTVTKSSRTCSNSSSLNNSQEKRSRTNSYQSLTSKTMFPEQQKTHTETGLTSLDSVLQLTLQLEETATANIIQGNSISPEGIDPLFLNGLTDRENQLNFIENLQDDSLNSITGQVATKDLVSKSNEEEKNSPETDRIQHNAIINSQTIEFVVQKEKLKGSLQSKYSSNIMFYSDLSNPISPIPYFYYDFTLNDIVESHLVICVHGLDGNSGDLRLLKTYLELCLPASRLEFLMSSANHSSTFDDIDIMVKNLIDEIDSYLDRHQSRPQRISFIGHSLGNLIIRATVAHTRFERYRPLLYTYLSLSGPHLGTLFNTSGLVNMGMWLMQKWKKSCSLSQMSFKDHTDPKQTYLYNLSKKPSFQFFKNILLVASPQDRYVPFHSARIELCKAALKDTAYGSVYVEMINNILGPILHNPSITFIRYNAFHSIPPGTNNIIGRAAHIAILDSELFVEKLILVSVAKYFK